MVSVHHTPHYEPRQVGDVFFHRGQRYDVVRIDAHRRQDGSMTELVAYTSRCKTCGTVFEGRSPNRLALYPNRRCKAHAQPRKCAGGPRNPRRKRSGALPPVKPSLTTAQIGEVIVKVAEGAPSGEPWSPRPQDARGLTRVLVADYGQTPGQARAAVASWLKDGIIEARTYRSKTQRKDRQGLFLGPAASVFG